MGGVDHFVIRISLLRWVETGRKQRGGLERLWLEKPHAEPGLPGHGELVHRRPQ